MSEPVPSDSAAQRLRFPRLARVVRRGDFQRIFSEGVRVRGDTLVLVMAANELDRPRLGLSIGKTIWKSAVKRNFVRRVFREAFRLEQHELPRGFDVIAIAARPKLEPELAEARAEMVRLARKGAARWNASTPEQRAADRERRSSSRRSAPPRKPSKPPARSKNSAKGEGAS